MTTASSAFENPPRWGHPHHIIRTPDAQYLSVQLHQPEGRYRPRSSAFLRLLGHVWLIDFTHPFL